MLKAALDVCLFLTGMMLLAALAKQEGLFDWLAGIAVERAHESKSRLFLLIYGVGVLVTVFLSNDATAVVLTPAVFAAVKKAKTAPLPYLYACAFISNAASFMLPISNPANLVVYGKDLPALFGWLRIYALPSLLSIAVTYGALRLRCRQDLTGTFTPDHSPVALSSRGRHAAYGLLATAAILLICSGFGMDLGFPTFLVALVTVLLLQALRSTAKEVSWRMLPLVAGLFFVVDLLNRAGITRHVLDILDRFSPLQAAFAVMALANLMNNLPAGLLVSHAAPHIRSAVLIGIDLGPNLSVTGSLATLLWMIALRKEGLRVTAWSFLKMGAVVMTPALLASTLALSI